MSYFLSKQTLKIGQTAEIAGAEARHILKSRRVSIGEQITLQDPDGERFLAEVVTADKNSLTVKPIQKNIAPPEPELSITLFQAAVKEKSLDNILQKTTELGVARLTIWNAAHSPEKITPKFKQKISRWQKIIDEACKQSDRERGPELALLPDFTALLSEAKILDMLIVLDANGTDTLEFIIPSKTIGLVIGPEGGLDNNELARFREMPNARIIKFGPRVLRADTAAIAAVSIIQNRFGDLK